jgi:predicted ATPase/class 3 adenylate cyclase/tetratricopeptide (TPR) repeat protein
MAVQAESGTSFARPTGTVTFLFSDIEGSTVRWERDREAMAGAVARHDGLLRAALEGRGGYIFKTMGDAFCVAFARPEDAIAAALDGQRALSGDDFSAVDGIRVRMALHTGSAGERDGDYFGPAVNRVARLLAIGHGGQVLVSGTAADLLQGVMPQQSSLRDLGAQRLKDLARPEQVYQLVAPDLEQAFPPLLSLDRLPNNLPPQLTSFVGRDREVAEIKALLEQHRFVTLVGTGGAGKTRCAIQVGADFLDGSGDGVWLAELAPISDSSLVASVIARALNVQGEANRPVLDALLTFLKRRQLLLIVDNCEHVIDEARNIVGAILRACPDVRILATSREGLNVAGERVYRMPSLPLPPATGSARADTAQDYGAIALFVDRAQASDGRFTFSDENATHVAEICRRLDGIPLAIELAAARVKVLSPQQLARKLDERFRVLTGGDRSALPRQQTMRALVDWSYDLLSEDERTLFRKLGIFAGGFTLESASSVCSDGTIDEIAVLDLLSSLVDKSLVHAEPSGNGTRYRLLESMRQYARERLTERGEYTTVAQAHAAAFLAFAEDLGARYDTMPTRAWSLQAVPEIENCRAALEWSLMQHEDVALGRQLAAAMRWVWTVWAPAEGRRWVHTATTTVDGSTDPVVIARLELIEASLDLTLTQRKAAYELALRALAHFTELNDARGIAEAQCVTASASLLFPGEVVEGMALLSEALSTAQRLGLRRLQGSALMGLANKHSNAGEVDDARRRYAEALAISRATGNELLSASATGNLAEAEFHGGDTDTALTLAREALEGSREWNNSRGQAVALCNIAAYLIAAGRYDEARPHGRECVIMSRDAHAEVWLVFGLQHLAALAAFAPPDAVMVSEPAAHAARLLGYVDVRMAALEALREYTEQHEYDTMLPALRAALGEGELAKLMSAGNSWTEEQAIAEAMRI